MQEKNSQNWNKKLQKLKLLRQNQIKQLKNLKNNTKIDINYFYSGKKLPKLFRDEINRSEKQVKNSPKLKWKLIVIRILWQKESKC